MKVSPPWDRRPRRGPDDQALPLINIAFLLLVFFLLAGTLLPPSPFAITELELLNGAASLDAPERLLMAPDRRMAYRGEALTREGITASLFAELEGPLRVQVDATTEAQQVVNLLRRLAAAGVERVELIGIARLR